MVIEERKITTSATGGFLQLSPGQGEFEVEDVLHDVIAGVTGLPGPLVRPRWQPDPPEVPEPDVDWCAFGIIQFEPGNLPVIVHHGEGEGHSEIVDTEELQVMVSFYGPRHTVYARAMRRGIYVPQNRELLRPAGLAFVRAGTTVPVPEQVALGWRSRTDLPLTFRLETRSGFSVLNLKKSQGRVHSDTPRKISVPTGCEACFRNCVNRGGNTPTSLGCVGLNDDQRPWK